jgi:hypothetical protein
VINIIRKGLSEYLAYIQQGVRFSLTRYWDGEMHAIVGRGGKNVDSCAYSPELGEALRQTLQKPKDYYHCLYYPMDHRSTKDLRRQFLEYLIGINSRVPWYDAMVFQSSFCQGSFYPVVQALKNRSSVLVAGEHLRPLADKYKIFTRFIEAPRVDAFAKREEVKAAVRSAVADIKDPVVVFCLGMASNVIIDDLHGEVEATIIDMGSVLDALLKLSTRQWMRSLPDIIVRRNLYGA